MRLQLLKYGCKVYQGKDYKVYITAAASVFLLFASTYQNRNNYYTAITREKSQKMLFNLWRCDIANELYAT